VIEILHRYTSAVLYKSEKASDIREAVVEATKSGADLSGAQLSGADLSGVNLSGADLSGAQLCGADLYGANLYGVNLSGADLSGAQLCGADLYGAHLYGAEGLDKHITTPLYMLNDQVGKIRAYKLVNSNGEGPYNGGITYEVGGEYSVEDACTDETEQCAAGISLATLDWCLKVMIEGHRILVAEFTRKDIAAIPIGSDGKFRVHRCKIVAEKDLKEIGLLRAEAKRQGWDKDGK
jgi:uncharacterized protein YjbI with pentapeptide repeats